LWDFATEVNNGNTFEGVTVNLTANIDLACSEDNQWVPIGDYSSNSTNVFKGTFNGQKYTISGIYINSDKRYQGLFGSNVGTIKNLTIEGQVSSSGSCTGAVVGYNSGNITELINKATITAGDNSCSSNAGRAVIIKCQNSGLIEGSSYVGGLCGANGDASGGATSYIKKSVNTGNVKSYTYNTASSESTMAYVGGIVGETGSGYVEECQNYGNVEGLNLIGGIAGLSSSTISRCSNFGEIKAAVSSENNSTRLTSIQSAGIVSYNYGEIDSCFNTGKVIASVSDNLSIEGLASGLVSNNVLNEGIIQNSYTTGQLEATTSTSIIKSNGGIVTNCYYLDTSCNAQYEETQNQAIKSCTSDNMKTAEFINTLNSNAFEIDSNNQNNGYPVLKEIQGVSIIFEDEILYKKILEKVLHKIENYNDETMTIEMTQASIDSITTLELDNNSINSTEKIQSINGIEKFTKLTRLDLAFNNISDISKLQYLTNLESLSLEANNISNIDAISRLVKLKTLYLNYNDITTIPVLNCAGLTYLNLATNRLTDISNISSLTNLEEVYLYDYTINGVETDRANAIADISVLDGLEKLKTIDARNQKLTYIGIVGEEIELPLIFSQAKNQDSVAYTEKDFIINNCTLNGTKIVLGQDTTRKATITIDGGVLSGSSFSVTVVEILKGDANGDNQVDFRDILTINNHRLEKTQLTGLYLQAADATRDGIIDFRDILQVNRYRLGLDSL